MTHEFKQIIESYLKAKSKNLKSVLATVVAMEGSSYRRPGVRMLIREDGKMTGAVSGGCVEKEILRQSQSVFTTRIPKIMTYDGRYRLGCEGILYILIEPLSLQKHFLQAFEKVLDNRQAFYITSYFKMTDEENVNFGSCVVFDDKNQFYLNEDNKDNKVKEGLEVFNQKLKPSLKLVLIGAEHDAVQLGVLASLNGWEVTIVAPESDPKTLLNFPGAKHIENVSPQTFNQNIIDKETAVVLMTHSYSKDLQYLLRLTDLNLKYLGILGPARRREKLFQEILEHNPAIDSLFFEKIHAPAGINIGAETPQEIAVSIIAEILAVVRKEEVYLLKDKKGRIHSEEKEI
ncbi:xanthine and CO dehydrogenases maturation factor, XdhC/CoxF family [Galbibacter orientalis DSM 19592]|uniref:Xanthine and CO dehydrogenases maturation factor, XdhC/CoxF family n=2 Tax=Galbibacter TaxID=379068 RepID=I3C1Z8_9FLAO|nr:XdhC/CoxI family protein [Galbibacter orientalis]EIJ37641.1 xanthine and CO dehydrogenases maturation factor, XdhC/CoxF family [Galbibacter orientalis DSM 19592]